MGGQNDRKNTPFKIHRDAGKSAREYFASAVHFPEIEFIDVPWTLDRVRDALFESTYRNPVMLHLPARCAHIDKLTTDVWLTVELVHAIYGEWEGDEDETPPAACWNLPEWYLRGMAHFNGPTGERETAPMHAWVSISGDTVHDKSIDTVEVQILTDLDRLKAGSAQT